MPVAVVQFMAVMFTALALVPGGAHLMALSNKIGLDQEAYLTVQRIYRGWSLAGIAIVGAQLSTLWLAILNRSQPAPLALASAAFALLSATLIGFFLWVYPANRATDQWTVATDSFERLRRQWEYTHAANAALTLLALAATVAAVLVWRDR